VSPAQHGTPAAVARCVAVRIVTHAESLGRARAQERISADVRQQLLDAIYDWALSDLGLTPNQVWGSVRPAGGCETRAWPCRK
jgi:hypothetical protein